MIKLTRLNGEPFVLNADLIRYIEARPDTFITLTSGDRLVVREPMHHVMELSIRYQQSKHGGAIAPSQSAVEETLETSSLAERLERLKQIESIN